MARIRSIHPSLYTDEDFMSLSLAARVVLPGIWTECDDQGVFPWKPLTLKARILPADNADMAAILGELKAAGFICAFIHEGKEYGAVRNFRKFQRPKKPNQIYPLNAELREYVGLSPVSSEPVPNQFPTKGENTPQMEDGGWRMKGSSSAPPAAAPTKPKADRGTRWPKDQPVPDSWHEPVLARFRELGRAPPDIPLEAVKFAAYWTSKSGKDATKLDWPKTFLNWCLNARPDQRKPKQSTHRDFLDAGIDVAREYLADGGDAGGSGGAADPFSRPLLPA